MPTVFLQNLGCAKNQVDGERILGRFVAAGYTIAASGNAADTIIVNTCGFIQAAKEEAIAEILNATGLKATGLKGEGRCRRLLVAGCFSQRYRDEVRRKFPEVDLWLGVDDWEESLEAELADGGTSSFKRELSPPLHTQYLKIAEGCSHGCAYCAIPLIRGNFKSRPADHVVEEARWLEERGVRELILVAQDTSFYGRDSGARRALPLRLADLLELLLASTAIPWIRLMYLHPAHIDDGLLRLIAAEPRLCPYFDLPLQHASDPVLRAMKRPSQAKARSAVERIRSIVPGAALRSAFITGFPGETAHHFDELLRFVEEARFDKLGVFSFSPEEGTRAFSMRPRPRSSTATRRAEALMELQREISSSIGMARIGSVQEVIIDGDADIAGHALAGRTRFDAPEVDGRVMIGRVSLEPGEIVKVRISSADEYDLHGEPVTGEG